MLRSWIIEAMSRGRRAVQHRIGNPTQSAKAFPVIEIARKRHRSQGAQASMRFAVTRQRKHPEPLSKPRNRASGHISGTDDQNSFHYRIISRPMSFQITLQPGNLKFHARRDQTVLDAALAAGHGVPYSCRDGACGACKAHIHTGTIEPGRTHDGGITAEELAAGTALLCQAQPRSDLEIKVRSIRRVDDLPVKKLPARVEQLNFVASDVAVLKLKLPASQAFRFRAGQYIDFLLEGNRRRSFSIANAPANADHLELHIRRVDGGHFTGHVFERMKPRDIVRFEGPFGTFALSDAAQRPAILIAGGTGFAPIKSMIEDAITQGLSRPITLYWGARTREGLYMDALAQEWARHLTDFRYIPVLSEPVSADNWSGRRGLVHHAVMTDQPDLSSCEVYACGTPAMIDAARADLVARCALPTDAFFSDAFTFATF